MRHDEIMTNARYRAATGITDSNRATKELQDLVARELIDQTGLKRGASYTLSNYATSVSEGGKASRPNRRRQILGLLEVHGELSKSDVSNLLGLTSKTAEHWLRTLKNEGLVEPTAPGRGRRDNRYRLTPARPPKAHCSRTTNQPPNRPPKLGSRRYEIMPEVTENRKVTGSTPAGATSSSHSVRAARTGEIVRRLHRCWSMWALDTEPAAGSSFDA